jgi:hypothetical protein
LNQDGYISAVYKCNPTSGLRCDVCVKVSEVDFFSAVPKGKNLSRLGREGTKTVIFATGDRGNRRVGYSIFFLDFPNDTGLERP